MTRTNKNSNLEELFKTSLQEAKMKAKTHEDGREQGWSKSNKASEKRNEKQDKVENEGKKRPASIEEDHEQLDEKEVHDTPSYRFAAGLIANHPQRKKFRIVQDGDTSYLHHKDDENNYVQIDHKGGKIHWSHASAHVGDKTKVHSPEQAKKEISNILGEETLAASSLHPGARSISDPKAITKSKISMMQHMLGSMNDMTKSDLVDFFNKAMSDFGPGKSYGIPGYANEKSNEATIRMKPSYATGKEGAKPNMKMPKLDVKEDIDAMFDGQDLSEEFKDTASTLFEAAISARLVVETARLEEEYAALVAEEITTFTEDLTSKMDTYLDYVVESWMAANEVAIESTLRNELMEEFIDGLKDLFAEHYIDVPQSKVDVLEALADKVNALEVKLDETITENAELKVAILEERRKEVFEELSSGLALSQQEKYLDLVEGIEFNGDLEVYEKKLKIIKENYFKKDKTNYSSNITEETFEVEADEKSSPNPIVNRYAAAISRTVKK